MTARWSVSPKLPTKNGSFQKGRWTIAGSRFSQMLWRRRGVRTGTFSLIFVDLDLMFVVAGLWICVWENPEVLP
jgi:hypothetical protein